MLNNKHVTPKFWKDNKLTMARKACPKEVPDYRNTARDIIYGDWDYKDRIKAAKPYYRDVKKTFDWMVECLDRLGYVFDLDNAHSGQSVYLSTYYDPEFEVDDGTKGNDITYVEKTAHNEIFELSFHLTCLKWCEQNFEYSFADRTTGTIIFSSPMLDLDGGHMEATDFSAHSDAVTNSLRSSLYGRMTQQGLMYLLIGQLKNNFTRTHREIYEALVAKNASRLKTVLEAKWK